MLRSLMYVTAVLVGISAAVVTASCFSVVEVSDPGMEPALKSGCKALVKKKDIAPKVGDLIAFENDVYGENGEGHILVRRVAAVSGDTVEIKDNIFYLNGRPYTGDMSEAAHMESFAKRTLAEGQVFVLCDDRRFAMDSRDDAVGLLSCDELYGKVCFR